MNSRTTRSTDGGATWSTMSSLSAPNVWGLAIDPTQTNVPYAATNDDGIWQSRATYTNANSINPRGDVVGRYDAADGVTHGYLFSGANSPRLISPAPPLLPPTGSTLAATSWESTKLPTVNFMAIC